MSFEHEYQSFLVSISQASAGAFPPREKPEMPNLGHYSCRSPPLLQGHLWAHLLGGQEQPGVGKGDFIWTLKDGENSASWWWRVRSLRGPRRILFETRAVTRGQEWSRSGWLCLYPSRMMSSTGSALPQVMGKSVGKSTLEEVLAFESLSSSPIALSWGFFFPKMIYFQPMRSSRQPGRPVHRWLSGSVVAGTTFLMSPWIGGLVKFKFNIKEIRPGLPGRWWGFEKLSSSHWLVSFLFSGHTLP